MTETFRGADKPYQPSVVTNTTKPHSNDEERPPKVIFLSKGQFTLVDE